MGIHTIIDIFLGLGSITATFGSVYVAFHLSRRSGVEEKVASHDRQIRDTRTAIAECRTQLKMPSYPYTE